MSEFIFFVKLFCLTVAIVLVMQIQVGERTLETHAMGWVQTSALVVPINAAAQGGAKMVRDVTSRIHGSLSKTEGKKKKEKEEKKPSSSFRWDSIRSPEADENSPDPD